MPSQLRKAVRKVRRIAGRYTKKRYFKGKGFMNPNLGQMRKDLNFVKSLLNAEKKLNVTAVQAQGIAQLNGTTGSGHYVVSITPTPAQGDADYQRNGDSIKLCGAFLKFQFYQQDSTTSPIRGRIIILKVLGAPQSTSTVVSQYLNADPMVSGTIYDYNSTINTDFWGQYRKVYEKKFIVNETSSSQRAIQEVTIKLKLNHHVRFTSNTTTVSDGQYVMIILCDNGNYSTTNASTITPVPNSAVSTGLWMNSNLTFYYFDN